MPALHIHLKTLTIGLALGLDFVESAVFTGVIPDLPEDYIAEKVLGEGTCAKAILAKKKNR